MVYQRAVCCSSASAQMKPCQIVRSSRSLLNSLSIARLECLFIRRSLSYDIQGNVHIPIQHQEVRRNSCLIMNKQLNRPSWKLEVVDLRPFGPAGSSCRLQQTPGYSLPASLLRIITLTLEPASCCSLKKVEVQVGPKLGRGTRITSRFFTTHRLLVVLVLHHSLNTHIDKRHSFLSLPTLTPLTTDITRSSRKCIGIQVSLSWSILDIEAESTQEYDPTCNLSLGIFGLDSKVQMGIISPCTLQVMPVLLTKPNHCKSSRRITQ